MHEPLDRSPGVDGRNHILCSFHARVDNLPLRVLGADPHCGCGVYQIGAPGDGGIHRSRIEQVHLDYLEAPAVGHLKRLQMVDSDRVGGISHCRSYGSAAREQVGDDVAADEATRSGYCDQSLAHEFGRGCRD